MASLKVTLQSKFSKKGEHSLAQSVLFTAIMFATISVMFLPTIFDGGITGTTVLYAAAVGIFSYLYQIFYVLALSLGRMTLTVIINNFGMLIPMIVSVVMLGDPFTPLIGVGAVLAFVSLIFLAPNDRKKGIKPMSKGEILIGCGVGLSLGTFQCVNTVAMSLIGGAIYYPVFHCGTSLMLALVGAVLFKERFTVKQYVGISLGVIAILLLCI